MANWFVNEGPKWLFLLIYFLLNCILFLSYFFEYYNGKQFYYLRVILGLGLPFARGAAACLNFNCMLILIPVCRNLISFARGSLKCCRRNMRRQLDKSLTFHRTVGYAICLFTTVHVSAHIFNVRAMIDAHSSSKELAVVLSSLPVSSNGSYLNPIRNPDVDPIIGLLQTVPGVTGIIITLCLVVMVSSATEFIRHCYFEVFWYFHHLFILFFIGLIVHGIQGILRAQINMDVHDPYVCKDMINEWHSGKPCEVPQFKSNGPDTWKWVLAPLLLYMSESVIRIYRSCQKVSVTKILEHPSNVIELQLRKSGFSMLPGQYIFIKCSNIATLEWHPYTLTSCPQDDYFSVHIRIVGDWTGALATAVRTAGNDYSLLPSIVVDGPFGTATEDIFRYQTVMFIAAGIGVTPYASVLKDIWHKHSNSTFSMKLQKVYFFWICSDTLAFEWFANLLHSLEEQMLEGGNHDFLECHIYLTRGWNVSQARNIVLHDNCESDVITGLRQKTSYGRPHWDSIFENVAKTHTGTSVGVFFCGPKSLSKELHKACNSHSKSEVNGVHFFYNKENF